MSEHSLEARSSCLRRYMGLRINLFRAMHDARFYLAEDHTVIATRSGNFALTASVAFDPVFAYYYVRDCGWYRSDLSRLSDQDVPEGVQRELLDQLALVLG